MPLHLAQRLQNVETSAIRELFKLLGKPGIISFAGGFPDSAMFDVDGIKVFDFREFSAKDSQAYGGAYAKSKGVKRLKRRTLVLVYQVRGSWAYVKTMSGKGGYVKVSALTKP